ncbi:MAG: glycosyl hydrolase [Planctomycetota bacterium]
MRNRQHGFSSPAVLAAFGVCVALATTNPAHAVDGKRGWAGGQEGLADAGNANWYYHWWHTKPTGDATANAEWIPLVKYLDKFTPLQSKLDTITGYNDVDTILVLNEPERESQSDVSVTDAIAAWPSFEATGMNLITPGISDDPDGRAWIDDFMTQANANNYRMDGFAFHWYGASSPNGTAAANNFLSRVDYYWNTYGLPLWITEFAIHDWNGLYTDQQIRDANEEFLDIVIPQLESRSYVEAYSFYQSFDDSRVVEDVGGILTPTNVGDAYIPAYTPGETYDLAGADDSQKIAYLKGGTLTNSGAVSPGVKSVYAVEGHSLTSGVNDFSVSGAGWVEINAGATLEKTGANTVRLVGADINNRGSLIATSGSLSLEGGVQVAGTGAFDLHPGATISLGSAGDRAGADLAQDMQLRGGAIHSNPILDGTHSVSGTSTLHNTSRFSGDGLLVVNGSLVAPAGGGGGGLTKQGTGTLRLNNAGNTYEGPTAIEGGTLKLGAAATLSGTPSIEVEETGHFDVTSHGGGYTLNGQSLVLKGQVSGTLHATAGSTVTVLSSSASIVGDLTVSASTVSVGGTGFSQAPPLPSIVSAGLELNYDAALDVSGDATWSNAGAAVGDLTFGAAASATPVSDPAFPGIQAAYHIPTTGGASGLNGFFDLNGPRSLQDASFEVVFHVADASSAGDQVLFEAGGADRGVSLLLDNGSLSFNVNGDGAGSTTFSLSQSLGVGWHHAVGVIDLTGTNDNLANDSISLYVNNTLVGTLDNLLIDDWSGGNIAGVGEFADALGAGGSPVAYHDSVAAVRYYNNSVFDAADVEQNYLALVGVGATPPTTMHIDGNYTQNADGTLEIDLLDPATHDMLDVTGAATLGGLLDVSDVAGFAPDFGDSFTLVEADGGILGEFDTITLPSLAAGQVFVVDYTSTAVTLTVAGSVADFDFDGDVDDQDLAKWQTAFGMNAEGDADGDGDSDLQDLLVWQSEYTGSLTLPAASAVPEPSGVLLAALATLAAYGRRRMTR